MLAIDDGPVASDTGPTKDAEAGLDAEHEEEEEEEEEQEEQEGKAKADAGKAAKKKDQPKKAGGGTAAKANRKPKVAAKAKGKGNAAAKSAAAAKTPATTPTASSVAASSSSSASAGVLAAVKAAESEVEAAKITPEQRQAMWMKYLRSRNICPTRDAPQGKRAARSSKMPEALRAAVEADPHRYFDLWVRKGGNWGQVVLEETETAQKQGEEEEEFVFVRSGKVEDYLPAGTADAYRAAAREAGEEWYTLNPLLPDEESLVEYKIPTKHLAKQRTAISQERKRKFTGTITSPNEDVLKDLRGSGKADPPTEKPKSPDEIAEENERKKEEKEKRKREAQERAAKPEAKVKKWVAAFPKHKMDVLQAIEKGKTENVKTSIPSPILQEYTKLLEKILEDMTKHREIVEQQGTSIPEEALNDAQGVIETKIKHVSSWTAMVEQYVPLDADEKEKKEREKKERKKNKADAK